MVTAKLGNDDGNLGTAIDWRCFSADKSGLSKLRFIAEDEIKIRTTRASQTVSMPSPLCGNLFCIAVKLHSEVL